MSISNFIPGSLRTTADGVAFFASHGISARVMELGVSDALRRKMTDRIRSAMPWVPQGPMSSGLRRDYRWNYFSGEESLESRYETVWEEITAYPEAIVFFEATTIAGFVVDSSELVRLGEVHDDFAVVSSPEIERVWVFSHEPYGPWSIDPSKKVVLSAKSRREVQKTIESTWPCVRSEADAREYLARHGLRGELLDQARTARLRKRLLASLVRKGVRIPSYPLPQGRNVWDHLWNYLPVTTQLSDNLNDVEDLFQSLASETLLFFESRRCPAIILPRGSIKIPSLTSEHLYLVEWPQCRWMISLPKEALASPKSSFVNPAFVYLYD